MLMFYQVYKSGNSSGCIFSFSTILLCNHSGDQPQKELSKFVYRSERKEAFFKKKTPPFFGPAGTYCLNKVIS